MHPLIIHRRLALRAGLACAVALTAPSARACEFFSSNLRVTHPWTRATAEDAGFAVVCMKFDEVAQADRLIAVETPVADGAQIGGEATSREVDLVIPAGQETLLTEAGTHVRLVGLRQPLEIARSYPLRLVFAKGGTVDATLNVDYARFRFK